MQGMPYPWMVQQQQAGRQLCLILDGGGEECQGLSAARDLSRYCSLYSQTAVAELAKTGPVILLLEDLAEPGLTQLLQKPETNWGWLGSLLNDDLTDVTRHWRERMLVGEPGRQALYRFQDNRTLARVLTYLPAEQWPVFLGPLVSVCYWHDDGWCCRDNPAPGNYPVSDPAPWSQVPNPQAAAILHANILRYLLAEHSEALAALVEFQDPRIWLTQVLEQAHAWQWCGPQQLEFLVVRRLEEATRSSVIQWQPMKGETPVEHYERVVEQWRREGAEHV
ncbi:DUF4123 domain-containing protein [Pseudomonas sp. BCA14]|uniref:DUF4123 domain-containing protein n=1 Tax=unclassified Pseudomonas TaxID=196821 RepID=UPI00106E9B01|nr:MULTISPECIES: DUF4123 domain-containing protein [unclassified Pseudomonas]TFF01730.1 DUF4123 domain-containing protein [Pseudomonas sp. JMN1]TFF03658.1 DUF4123 domain-containing protein [Pseudomonas sp. BCA17]TFF18609.1 DUF4123 domain-containing protein [Pseudomonas sp. BCA13]TFF20017.1 DUF4123 domain-containing protein [Pseudomonas sp. BCA14]